MMMSDFLCVGDYISLFCEETEGYVYNWQTRYVIAVCWRDAVYGIIIMYCNQRLIKRPLIL